MILGGGPCSQSVRLLAGIIAIEAQYISKYQILWPEYRNLRLNFGKQNWVKAIIAGHLNSRDTVNNCDLFRYN